MLSGTPIRSKQYVDSVLNANRNLNFVQRYQDPSKYPRIQTNTLKGFKKMPNSEYSTHLMAHDPGTRRVYPEIVQLPDGSLKHLTGDDAWNYADSTGEYIQFPTAADAEWFANSKNNKSGYKMGTQRAYGGVTMKRNSLRDLYANGGYTDPVTGDPVKVTTVPAGYVYDPTKRDPNNPGKKFYKKTTIGATPPAIGATLPTTTKPSYRATTGARRTGQGTRLRAAPTKPSITVTTPSVTPEDDYVFTEETPAVTAPTPTKALFTEHLFDTNKHALGQARYLGRDTPTQAQSGNVSSPYQDVEFEYYKPNSSDLSGDIVTIPYQEWNAKKPSTTTTIDPKFIEGYRRPKMWGGGDLTGILNAAYEKSGSRDPEAIKGVLEGDKGGGGGGWGATAQAFTGLMDIVTQLTEGGGYTKEPLVNSDIARSVLSPYAWGGTIDDLDEVELAQLQQAADEQGVDPQEIFDTISQQQQEENDYEAPVGAEENTQGNPYQGMEDDFFAPQQQQQEYDDGSSYYDEEDAARQQDEYGKGGWIKKAAASIKRRGTKGKCTPITKPGCTGRARALALTFKKIARRRKGKAYGGDIGAYAYGGNVYAYGGQVMARGGSVVDYLSSKGMDSSFQARQALAVKHNISNYDKSAGKNMELLRALKGQSGAGTKSSTKKYSSPSNRSGPPMMGANAPGVSQAGTYGANRLTKEELRSMGYTGDISKMRKDKTQRDSLEIHSQVDSKKADKLRKALPLPKNAGEAVAKLLGDSRMSTASLTDEEKVQMWDMMQNAKKRTGNPHGGTEYEDYQGQYGTKKQFNDWFNKGKPGFGDIVTNSATNAGFRLASTVGRGNYWTDPETGAMTYTDVYDYNKGEKDFKNDSFYTILRNMLRHGEAENLGIETNNKRRTNFTLTPQEVAEAKARIADKNRITNDSMVGIGMATGGTVSKSKAREILHDGTAHGHPLTGKQRRFFGYMSSRPYGGRDQNQVEVEGGEVVQPPGQGAMQVSGASHEDGGVPMDLPEGTKVFSDRIKMDGKSMVDRKKEREKTMVKLARKYEKNPFNALLRNTIERTGEILETQEQQDMALQNAANKIYAPPARNAGVPEEGNMPQEQQAQPMATAAYGGCSECGHKSNRRMYALGDYVYDDMYGDENYMVGTPGSYGRGYGAPLPQYAGVTQPVIPLGTGIPLSAGPQLPSSPGMTRRIGADPYAGQPVMTRTPLPNITGKVMNPPTSYPMNKAIHPYTAEELAAARKQGVSDAVDANGNPYPDYKFGAGDYLGMVGTLGGGLAQMANTKAAFENTPPVRNRYRGVGHEALDINSRMQDIIARGRGNMVGNIRTDYNTAVAGNRGGALGINTARALDAGSAMARDKAILAAELGSNNQLSQVLQQRTALSNWKDQMEAKGETDADTAREQIVDAFFKARGQNLSDMSKNVQTLGRNVNQGRQNQATLNMTSQLSKHGYAEDASGRPVNVGVTNATAAGSGTFKVGADGITYDFRGVPLIDKQGYLLKPDGSRQKENGHFVKAR